MPLWTRVRNLAFFAVAALIVSACQVDLDVSILIDSDGSGRVDVAFVLDETAAAKLPKLEEQLRTDDLVAAGWEISEFEVDDSSTTVSASKDFSSPAQLQGVLDELTGRQGMLQDFRIAQEAEFAERRYELSGVIDLRRGLALFTDPELTSVLGGQLFGRPLDFYLEGSTVDEVMSVRVEVILPGEGDGSTGSRASWTPRFDDPLPIDVKLQTVDENFLARLLRWIGLAGFALFALSVVLGSLAFFLERRARQRRGVGKPSSVRSRVPRGADAPNAAAAAGPQAGGARRMRLVCLDPLGVLYNTGSDPVDLLVSFIRSRGSNVSRAKIDELHTRATLGRISSGEFWEGVGVQGAPDDLDAAYIELIEPRNGAAEFLREMRRREVPVTCITNDLSAWSRRLRERDNLAMIWPWVISADVGVRKPDPGIFEALRREAGVPYEACLLIDTDAEHLDTARTLGMSTAFFSSRKLSPNERPRHPVVTSFSDFFRRRASV